MALPDVNLIVCVVFNFDHFQEPQTLIEFSHFKEFKNLWQNLHFQGPKQGLFKEFKDHWPP